MSDLATQIIDRADRMKSDRAGFESVWQDVRDYIMPMASSPSRIETPGQKADYGKVIDNSGESAHEMLAGSLVSITTPDTADWFALRALDESLNRRSDAGSWFEDCASRMLAVFRSPRGGFCLSQHEKYLDVIALGTCGGFIADRPGRGIVFSSVPLRQLLLDEDSDGFVDTVYRDFTLTARQAVQRWGERCGPKIVKAADDAKRRDTPFRIIHAVCPRDDLGKDGGGGSNLPLASVYVSVEGRHVIGRGGFHEMPYVTPRWAKRGDEIYGRGPGMKALADVRSLQRGMRINFGGAELAMKPPMMVADDGIVSPVRMNPGGLIYYRTGAYATDPIKPLITGARPDLGEDLMAGIRTRIDNAFMKPLIQMIRKDRMTATEVLQVVEEGQRILGPYLGRLKTEDLGPMITRVFNIMLRGGGFAPMPKALAGAQVEIEYVSPAVKAQRVSQARGLAQFMDIVAPLAQINPGLLDNLDADRACRDTADVLGLPKDWLRPTEQVDALRQERQRARQQQAQQQAMVETVDAGATAVRALPALRQAMASPEASNAA